MAAEAIDSIDGSAPVRRAPTVDDGADPRIHRSEQLDIDDDGVTARRRPGLVEHIDWADLVEVAIRSKSDGASDTEHYWLLGNRIGAGVVVPHPGPQSDVLLQRLSAFRGLDVRKVAEGLATFKDELIVVWREGR